MINFPSIPSVSGFLSSFPQLANFLAEVPKIVRPTPSSCEKNQNAIIMDCISFDLLKLTEGSEHRLRTLSA